MNATRSAAANEKEPRLAPSKGGILPLLLLAGALALLATILLRSMAAAPTDATSDDGYYLRYMQSVGTNGLGEFPKLFELWNATQRDWIFPPPSRIGFVVVSALWSKAFGASLESLQQLSLASHLLLVVLNWFFARRRFGEPRALFIALGMGFSPLLMGISRLALTDSFVALCMTTTVWLFLDLLEDPRSRRRSVLFMASLGFMVLVKELSVLLMIPFVAFLLFERFVRRVPHDLRRFGFAFAIPGIVTAPLFVLAAGGVAPLLETTRIVLASPATNRWAILYGSGPWFRAVLDYLLFSPWPTLLAIGWVFGQALRLREGRYERESAYLAFVAAFLILALSFFTKNIRYTVVLELPIRVFTVLFLWDLFGGLRRSVQISLTGALVATFCFLDWQIFQLVWVERRCADPVTYFLAIILKLVPPP
jgi:4-amino-4-deoxy-L-arabinose transferase-like glycosyltransferase